MKTKLIFALAIVLTAVPAMAEQELVPYIGADAKWSHMSFCKGEGNNLIKRDYPQGNFYGGAKFNDWVAFEAGYESTTKKTKSVTLNSGDNLYGQTIPSFFPDIKNTAKSKIHGFHANVVGFYPVSEAYRLSLIGSLGLSQVKLRVSNVLAYSATLQDSFQFVSRRWIPRVNVGVQHMLDAQTGLRAMVGWERTGAFKNMTTAEFKYVASAHNTTNFGLGVFYNFK